MKIELDSSPKADDLAVLSRGIKAFNREYLPDEVVFEEDTRFADITQTRYSPGSHEPPKDARHGIRTHAPCAGAHGPVERVHG